MWVRICGVVACGVALWAAPVRAQDADGIVGYGGGAIRSGDFNPGSGGRSVGLGTGWVARAEVENWMGSSHRVGARAGVGFSQRSLDLSDGDPRNIDTWLFDGDLVLRLLPATPERSFAPFVTAGAGVVNYRLGTGSAVVLSPEKARYPGDAEWQFAPVFGGGFDVYPQAPMLGKRIGIRLQALDHMSLHSPFDDLEGKRLGPVHNVSVGLSLLGLVDLFR